MPNKTFKEHAYEKLETARFHLAGLKREKAQIVPSESQNFQAFVDAFLNASYATDQAIRNYTKTLGLRNWHQTNLSEEEAKFLTSMLTRRGAEIHAAGAARITKKKYIPADRVPGARVFGPPGPLGPVAQEWNRQRGLPLNTRASVVKEEYYFKTKNGDVEISAACDSCFALLERLVQRLS